LMDLDSYGHQPIRLFIIGQETNGWSSKYDDIESLLKTYREFNMGEGYYSSPFWNITRKLEDLLSIDHYSCAWSNINRYDHNGREPKGEILKEIRRLDFLVREELSLIHPDVCFFFTNRKYDYRLRELYSGVEMHEVKELPYNHFCRLEHQDLPLHTYRTPHPRTIRTRKWERAFLSVMEKLLPKVDNAHKGRC